MKDAERQQEIARSLFLESGDALFYFDTNTHRVIDANPAALRLTGYDRRTVTSRYLEELFQGETATSILELVEGYCRTGYFRAREGYRLIASDGSDVPVSVNVSRIHVKPEPIGLIAARDISEVLQAREVVDRFFQLSPALFTIIELDNGPARFLKLNPAWEATSGYSLDELMAMDPIDLVHPDDRAAAEAGMLDFAREGAAAPSEHRMLRRDGGVRWIFWRGFVIDGRLYAIGHDTTEERRTAALTVAKEAAEAANRAKGDFLAFVSHELRTPLSSMMSFADLLLGDPYIQAAPPTTLEAIQTLRHSGEALGALIDDLLSLTQIESGILRVQPTDCRLGEFVADLTAAMSRQAAAKGLRLVVEPRGDLPDVISIDALRLRQVLANLLGNAIKFTETGEVCLEYEAIVEGGRPAIAWTVADTGPGIPEEDRRRLFEPFARGTSARAKGIPGTGLGLAISRRLATLLGGRLELQSEPGRGSRFTLTVPAEPIEAPSRADMLHAEPIRLNARVLLAEDDEANRRGVALQLERAGAEVATAGDGESAVAMALAARDEKHPFDVILMDMRMPVVDGPEAISRLREAGIRTPIIALTADVLVGKPNGRAAGYDDVLSKPFLMSDLADRIAAQLARGVEDAAS